MQPSAYPYKLIRGVRRTVLIRITEDAEVEVLAPKKLDKRAIDEYLKNKQDWIEKKLEAVREVLQQREQYNMETLDFLGIEYPVKNQGKRVVFHGDLFLVPEAEAETRRALIIAWYKNRAKEIIAKRVGMFAEKMGAYYDTVKITSARTRWGSCTAKNRLNFSWRLMMAPGEAIDYVVIHELAHTKIREHNKEFYELVLRYCGGYQRIEENLKLLGAKLSIQNW
jgi:predicted metal-dependent hydrolase